MSADVEKADGSRIEGKVAELLNDRSLVINRGSDHGVGVGMQFAVLNPKGAEILDPDTRQPLGSVELVKVVVKVTSVQEKLSVARTFRTFDTEASGIYRGMTVALATYAASLGTPGTHSVETLRSDERFRERDMDESESFIKLGDPVVQTFASPE